MLFILKGAVPEDQQDLEPYDVYIESGDLDYVEPVTDELGDNPGLRIMANGFSWVADTLAAFYPIPVK